MKSGLPLLALLTVACSEAEPPQEEPIAQKPRVVYYSLGPS